LREIRCGTDHRRRLEGDIGLIQRAAVHRHSTILDAQPSPECLPPAHDIRMQRVVKYDNISARHVAVRKAAIGLSSGLRVHLFVYQQKVSTSSVCSMPLRDQVRCSTKVSRNSATTTVATTRQMPPARRKMQHILESDRQARRPLEQVCSLRRLFLRCRLAARPAYCCPQPIQCAPRGILFRVLLGASYSARQSLARLSLAGFRRTSTRKRFRWSGPLSLLTR